MRSCLVTGSGRSGTSMLAGILHQSGYFMGEGLYRPNESNPKGFFENREVNGINEAILAPYGRSLLSRTRHLLTAKHSVRSPGRNQHWLLSLPPGVAVSCGDGAIRSRIAELAGKTPFAYKDPRFSYTLPVWRELLPPETAFLCVFRDPAVTAESILRECRRRRYLKSLSIGRQEALEVWHRIYSRLIAYARKEMPRFLFLHYEALLDGSALDAVSRFLDADITADFVDRRLNRTRAAPSAELPRQIRSLYRELLELAGSTAAGAPGAESIPLEAVHRPVRGVSAVLCCHNSAALIAPTIGALRRQAPPEGTDYEVVLVDNNCTDETVGEARQAWGDGGGRPLRVVEEKTPGLLHARRRGTEAARCDTILFVDDDNVLSGDWVSRLAGFYDAMPRVGSVAGYNEAVTEGPRPSWFDRFEGVYACGPRDRTSTVNPRKLFGAGVSYRTSLLRLILSSPPPLFLVGRTGQALTRGEDTEIALRCRLMGWDIYYDETLRLGHRIPSRRLEWEYVCTAREQNGRADVILRVYRDLLAGRAPMSFRRLRDHVGKRMAKYLEEAGPRFDPGSGEGGGRTLVYFRLRGMLSALEDYGKDYDAVVARIVSAFGGGADSPPQAEGDC